MSSEKRPDSNRKEALPARLRSDAGADLARAPPPCGRRRHCRCGARRSRRRPRLRAAQAPRRRPQFRRRLRAAEAAEDKGEGNGQLADLRPQPGPHSDPPVKGVKPPFRKLWRFTDDPCLSSRRSTSAASSTSSTTTAPPTRSMPTPASCSGNAASVVSTPLRLPITNTASTSSTSFPADIVKLDAKTGKTIWKRSLPGRAESSPVVIDRTVYFGGEGGGRYALSTISGNVRWATSLNGPVKSAPAYYGGTLYVGDYGGSMNAVDAKTGKIKWQTSSLGQGFGTSGQFFSTPAVAFGRVYAGNNDGRVYSFARKDGTLAWSDSTGGYAYSGPTVSTTRHSPPTVYIGSFDGNVYALDAKDGSLRWSRSAGGQVVGSLSAIGDIVYVAEFTHNSTSGFTMRSGRRVFRYRRGTYSPVISDGRRLYLTGYLSITALEPYEYRAEVARRVEAPKGKTKPRPSAPGRGAGAAALAAGSGEMREHRVVEEVAQHGQARRVVLDPVRARRTEVLVVDEHLAARVATHPDRQLGHVGRVVAAGDAELGQREGLVRVAVVEAVERFPVLVVGVEVGADPVDVVVAGVEVTRPVLRDGRRADRQRARSPRLAPAAARSPR